SRSPTLISAYSSRNGLVNPRFGMRRWMGICPPSKPMKFMLPVRAFWPLPPRPAVLPVPLACPRPTLFFSFTPPPRGGVSLVSSFMSRISILQINRRAVKALSICFLCGGPLGLGEGAAAEGLECLGRFGPLDQVGHLVDHPADGGRVLEDPLATHAGEAHAAQARAVPLRVSAHTADEL